MVTIWQYQSQLNLAMIPVWKIQSYHVVFHIAKRFSFHEHFPKYDTKRPDIRLFAIFSTLEAFSRFPRTPERNKKEKKNLFIGLSKLS